jgi:hypothetical protein|nr:MAG: hypothetical protein DIU64_09705 [Caldicoprobacter oshimai]
MGVLPKEVVREIIKENNFQTPQEIMKFLKDCFKDILQCFLQEKIPQSYFLSKSVAFNIAIFTTLICG